MDVQASAKRVSYEDAAVKSVPLLHPPALDPTRLAPFLNMCSPSCPPPSVQCQEDEVFARQQLAAAEARARDAEQRVDEERERRAEEAEDAQCRLEALQRQIEGLRVRRRVWPW